MCKSKFGHEDRLQIAGTVHIQLQFLKAVWRGGGGMFLTVITVSNKTVLADISWLFVVLSSGQLRC
jgi:hypothetical protein